MSKSRLQRHEPMPPRLLMTFSSFAPLFILWAVRGTELIPDMWFITGCLLMSVVPTLMLWFQIRIAKKQKQKIPIAVGSVEDHRMHVLVYLFAILLPFYSVEITTFRDLFAMILALAFIKFLFFHLNLYYMNIIFAIFKFQVFLISPPNDGNPYTGREPIVLITYRRFLDSSPHPSLTLSAYRLSDTVYFENKT